MNKTLVRQYHQAIENEVSTTRYMRDDYKYNGWKFSDGFKDYVDGVIAGIARGFETICRISFDFETADYIQCHNAKIRNRMKKILG